MEAVLEKLFDIKRIPTKLIFVLWISSGIILFLPENLLLKLNLVEFNQEYGKYLGITFILASALLGASLFTYLLGLIKKHKNQRRFQESILASLRSLDFHEKALLREFYIHGKSTLQLPFDNDTVAGLSNKGIIYQASATGFTYSHGAYFSFSIDEFAKQHITSETLDLPNNPTDEKKQKIMNERPQWARNRSHFDSLDGF